MSAVAIYLILSVVLGVFAVACFRISEWHTQESRYWNDIAWRVRLDPKLGERYRPILDWAQTERPDLWERARGWQPPEQRMGVAA